MGLERMETKNRKPGGTDSVFPIEKVTGGGCRMRCASPMRGKSAEYQPGGTFDSEEAKQRKIKQHESTSAGCVVGSGGGEARRNTDLTTESPAASVLFIQDSTR